MSKIGLLTFHRTTNFGSLLQTFGLYYKITSMGYDCELIDYRCPAIEERENLKKSSIHSVKDIAKYLLIQPAINRKAKALSQFSEQHMRRSKIYTPDNIIDSNDEYDKIIVGSDIVWGLDITGKDLNYFLQFVKDPHKKYAFSSSVGTEAYDNKEELKLLLQSFQRIAVRESTAVDWVKRISGKEADWVCDPTMLLTSKEWEKVIPLKNRDSNYVLVYFNNKEKKPLADAKEYARLYGKKVLFINYGIPERGVVNIKPSSLSEFLSYICFAEHVFTASYHGLLFSLYFKKELSFYTRDHAARMISIAEKLGIEKQCGDNSLVLDYQRIDYSGVDQSMDTFRAQSLDVLQMILRD